MWLDFFLQMVGYFNSFKINNFLPLIFGDMFLRDLVNVFVDG